jgi:ribosomal protein S18 acetylase RimI-like enzyme
MSASASDRLLISLVRRFDSAEVADVIEGIQQFYIERYGSRDEDETPAAEFTPPHGLFLLGSIGEEIVASGGWRWRGPGTVEIKRMWVRAEQRGQGIARAMLGDLETRAKAAGAVRVVLNTGYLQPEAIALYESSGYHRTDERYGHYAEQDGAYFFSKALD